MLEEGQEAEFDCENRGPSQDQVYPVESCEEVDLNQQRVDVVDTRPAVAEETQRVQTRGFDEVDGRDGVEEQASGSGQADAG